MLKIGDMVKVTGKTIAGDGKEKEIIPIDTICKVVDFYKDEKDGLVIQLRPEGNVCCIGEYWYLACDVEKGHLEWVRDK